MKQDLLNRKELLIIFIKQSLIGGFWFFCLMIIPQGYRLSCNVTFSLNFSRLSLAMLLFSFWFCKSGSNKQFRNYEFWIFVIYFVNYIDFYGKSCANIRNKTCNLVENWSRHSWKFWICGSGIGCWIRWAIIRYLEILFRFNEEFL